MCSESLLRPASAMQTVQFFDRDHVSGFIIVLNAKLVSCSVSTGYSTGYSTLHHSRSLLHFALTPLVVISDAALL